jgi:electron transport complex protein RnfG
VRVIIRMVVVLTAICAASGLTLSVIYRVTETPIEYQTIKFVKEPAVKQVLTGYENDPIMDRVRPLPLPSRARARATTAPSGSWWG